MTPIPAQAYSLLTSTSHFLEDGYDIRTVRELLGYKNVSTTMIDTHVLNREGRSPVDEHSGSPQPEGGLC